MKKKIFTLVAGACFMLQASAQTTQVIDISTGVSSSGTLIYPGSLDDTWVVQKPGTSTFVQTHAVVAFSAWENSFDARWIDPQEDGSGGSVSEDAGDYIYKTTFTTTGCASLGKLMLAKYGGDNKLVSISVNGHAHMLNAGYNPLSGILTLDITSDLVVGTNTLTALVNNAAPGSSRTGLFIYGNLQIKYPDATMTISGNSAFCRGDALSFTAVGAPASSTYKWELIACDIDGTPISGGYTWSQTYSGTIGAYTFPVTPSCNSYYLVKGSVLNSCGTWSGVTKVIYINCSPIAETGPNQTICSGSCANLGNTGQSHVSYQWVTNSGHSSIVVGTTAQITVCPRTTTTYTLTATSSAGCTSSAVVTVSVTTNDPSFSLSDNTSNPSYYTVTATPNVLSPSASTGYVWMIEDLNSSGNDIFIIDNPSIWWTFPATPSNVFQGFDGSYPYTPAPTHVTSLPSSPAVGKFLYNHNYRITRATWDDYCPWTTYSQMLTVVKSLGGQPQVLITEDPIGPDPGVFANMTTGITAAEANVTDPLSVYPNPGTGVFTITPGQSKAGVLEVYDVVGNKVQSIQLNGASDYKLDLSGYSKGMYMLNMISGDQRYTKKIILE